MVLDGLKENQQSHGMLDLSIIKGTKCIKALWTPVHTRHIDNVNAVSVQKSEMFSSRIHGITTLTQGQSQGSALPKDRILVPWVAATTTAPSPTGRLPVLLESSTLWILWQRIAQGKRKCH